LGCDPDDPCGRRLRRARLRPAHDSDEYNARIRDRLGSSSPNAPSIEALDLEELDGRLLAAGATIVDLADVLGDALIDRLEELVRANPPCVVLTGAGISTESGIPDFRSPTGIWARYDRMEYATIEAFLADPAKVWEFYGRRLAVLGDAQPNDGHRALAELEDRGWVQAVITQNIDRLHERAGSRALVEVHGSIRTSSCLDCGTVVPFDEVVALLPVPACPDCGRLLKPDVVMFGELLPAAEIARAERLARGAGLMLVVGSSLEVHPVAGLPLDTRAQGGGLAIVNRGTTPYDARASLVVDGGAGETLGALAERLQ
jgi:NAD-dependent deacetylase